MSSRVRRVLAAGVAALVALPLISTQGSASAQPPPPDWQECADSPGFECATAAVPLDYDEPDGATIDLALIRRPASDPARRIGSLFFNPGGPGGSGVAALPPVYSFFPAEVRARFDLVSFDPRGIGQSAGLQCFASQEDENELLGKLPVGFPVGADEQRTWIDTYAEFARSCAENGGPILDHMSTANVARDMDELRELVRDDRLSYYGPSYGSYLAATYANLFPDKVRAIVSDANVDPLAWTGERGGARLGTFLREGSDLGSAETLRLFLRECGRVGTDRCAFSAGSPRATRHKYAALLASLKDEPVSIGTPPQEITYSGAVIRTVSMLYTVQESPGLFPGWKNLATFLQDVSEATAGSRQTEAKVPAIPSRVPRPVLGDYAGPEQSLGVYCSESPNPRDPASYPRQADLAAHRSGDPAYYWTWVSEACAEWPVTDADRYNGPFDRPTAAPILVVGVANDPATPYRASVAMAATLADARLLKVTGGGHTALLNPSRCAQDHMTAYLVRGTLPPVGTTCHQDRPPF